VARGYDRVVKYIAEARELGIQVLPPDVNESGYKFTVVGDRRIRFGLGAIRNVGRTAIDSMLEARNEKPFTSVFDLCERVDLRICNKRVFEALIHSGALDGLGGHRAQHAAVLDAAMQEASLKQAERTSGQVSLFGDVSQDETARHNLPMTLLPNLPVMTDAERLTKEKEILGFYISGHPLEPFRTECELFATHTVAQLGSWSDQAVALGVVVTAIRRQISKRSGAEFARLTIEDFSGSSEVLVFPEAWTLLADRIRTDVPVLMRGRYSRRDQGADAPAFIVESVTPFSELRATGNVAIALELGGNGSALPADVLRDVRAIVESHAGSAPVEVRWRDHNGADARFRSRTLKIAVTNAALNELRALLGDERVRLVRGS
jgi:DNA polymerase-3 subunit alpha